MAIPTCQQIFDGVRGLLGDTAVAGGGRYTNSYLRKEGFAPEAYRRLYRKLQGADLSKVERRVYHILPAYQAVLYPVAAGISNFGDLISIRERSFDAAYGKTITGVTLSADHADLTIATHPFESGWWGEVSIVGGISDDINDRWMLTDYDANTVRLAGCRASGTFTSGGNLTYSDESWTELEPYRSLTDITESTPSSGNLSYFAWHQDTFRFSGSSVSRQLEIYFRLSASFPTSDNASLGIDDCQGFLIYETAALAASRIFPDKAQLWAGIANQSLTELIGPQIRAQQTPILRPPFRAPRHQVRVI